MNHVWGEKDEKCLEQMERQELTASQRMIINQIRKW
ncbi:hypothetical protein IMSAGC007_02067 [Lachnospiraceae bacterium]|nr:hypothetical protein IMSAGC007_02067 [Lachnospiraceae bacterium]